jgi:hypothetical protein
MSFRNVGRIRASVGIGVLALAFALPASAEETVNPPPAPELPLHTPPLPGSPPPEGTADVRPEWQGSPILAPATSQIDPRAREAWLWECRRRTAQSYHSGWRGHRHRHDADHANARGPAYDYCEAYLDDYYRAYAQPAYAYPRSFMPMHVPQISAPREVEIEEYVPARTRSVPQRRRVRPVPDKRIKVQ